MASTAPTRTMTRRASHRSRPTRSLGRRRRVAPGGRRSTASSSTAGASAARSSPRRGHRRPPARRASGRRRPARRPSSAAGRRGRCSSAGTGSRPSAMLPQVLGGRRPVAGDEPLDALDDAGDPIGQAGQPLGGLGELVLRPPRRAARRTPAPRRAIARASAMPVSAARAKATRSFVIDAIGSAASTASAAESAATASPSRYVVPTRCTSTSPRMTATATATSPTIEQAGRDGSGRSATPSGQPCRAAR